MEEWGMTFSMATSKTIILISQRSNVTNSCHVTPWTEECFPKCKKTMEFHSNKRWKTFLLHPGLSAGLRVSWDRYVLLRRGFFLVPAALSGPGHAFKPSGHISLHSKNAAGHVSLGPDPPRVGGRRLMGAHGEESFPLRSATAFQKRVTSLYTYFTAF